MNWFNISILVPMIISLQSPAGLRVDFHLAEDGMYYTADNTYRVERLSDGMVMLIDQIADPEIVVAGWNDPVGTVNEWTFLGQDYAYDRGDRAVYLIPAGYLFGFFLDAMLCGLVWAFRGLQSEGRAAIKGAL